MNEHLDFENPINRKGILLWAVIAVGGASLSLLLIVTEHGLRWFGVLASLLLAALVLLVGWNIEMIRRPVSVEVVSSGIILHRRCHLKPISLVWNQFHSLNVCPDNSYAIDKWHLQDGFLFIDDKRYYTLHWHIAMAVREVYKQKVGRYPPNSYDAHAVDVHFSDEL